MLCTLLVEGIYAILAAIQSELGSDLYQEKKALNQNNFYAATTDSLVIVLGSKANPRPQPEQTRLRLAFNSENFQAEHVISETSFKH